MPIDRSRRPNPKWPGPKLLHKFAPMVPLECSRWAADMPPTLMILSNAMTSTMVDLFNGRNNVDEGRQVRQCCSGCSSTQ